MKGKKAALKGKEASIFASAYGTASHDVVQIKHWVCLSGGTVMVAYVFMSAVPMVFDSHHDNFRFGSSACTFQFIHATSFSLLFSKVSEV